MMKKLIAAGFTALTAVAVAGCGSGDASEATESTTTTAAELTDWKSVGVEGTKLLDDCTNDNDAIMYSCDHAGLISLSARMASLPDAETQNITAFIDSFQESYGTYWAAHKCGTPQSDAGLGTCDSFYRKLLEMSLAKISPEFKRLSAGSS